MGVAASSTRSTMSSFSLLAGAFCLFSLALICEGTLKEDFCTDVSFWDVIKYTSTTAKCCDTVLKEDCLTKTERVCEDATEIKCNTVGWAECTTKIWPSQGKKCHVTYKGFPYKDCKEEKYSVQHHKEVSECHTVTKDNCVTDWNIDEHGNKVWGGKEKCEPVTWEECKIVKKPVDFPAVKTNCEVAATIKWADFVQGSTEVIEMKQSCEVKSSVNCYPVKVNNCVDVTFTECEMKARDSCYSQTVYEPQQEKIHQKKCLTYTIL